MGGSQPTSGNKKPENPNGKVIDIEVEICSS
jgi:hypothetical protein